MEDGLSAFDSVDINFGVPLSTIQRDEEEEEAREALLRDAEINAQLQHAFDDFDDDDEDDSSSSGESDAESHANSSHRHSKHNHSLETSIEHSNLSHDFHQVNRIDDRQEYLSSSGYKNTPEEQSEIYDSAIVNGNKFQRNGEQEHLGYCSENISHFSDTHPNFSENIHSNQNSSAHSNEGNADIVEEYQKLQLLYETTRQELLQRKAQEDEIRKLGFQLECLEGEKERLSSSLQDAQDLISGFKHDNKVLENKLSAAELKFTSVSNAKDEVESKLESCEFTIQALEKQLDESSRSNKLSQLRSQSDSIIADLKLSHQKEVLKYKENIDMLQSALNTKTEFINNLEANVSRLQQKCEQLQVEKSDLFNKFSSQLDASQKRCEELMKSDTISEVTMLKLKVQHLENENAKLEKQNSTFKEEILSLEVELRASETLKKHTGDSLRQDYNQKQNELKIQSELERSLKNLRSQRSLNSSLKNQLEEQTKELNICQEKARLFELRYSEYEKKVKDLEEKLSSYTAVKTVPLSLHENKVKVLEKTLKELQMKWRDVTGKLNHSSSNEKILKEMYENLQKKYATMVQQHAQDKMQAIEECREKCLKIHESTLNSLKEELTYKADTELKTVCTNYENKMEQLKRELQVLNEGLYDSKAQYIDIFEQNKSLQKKLDDITKPKERSEIEAEIRAEYEEKISQIKESFQVQNEKILESRLKDEFEKAQMEWTKQKMAEVKDFVEKTKQNLDAEFKKCLQKEQEIFLQQLEAEKAKLQRSYQETMSALQKQFEKEKQILSSKLNQHFNSKWEEESGNLKKQHEQEMKNIKLKYDNKITLMEQEICNLKEKIPDRLGDQEKFIKLKEDFSHKQEAWDRERDKHFSTISELKQKIEADNKIFTEMEKALRDKIKKYLKHITALEKHYKDKCAKLQNQISNLQKSQAEKQEEFFIIKEQYEKEFRKMEGALKSTHKILKNSECQTSEEVVPRQTIIDIKNWVISCLRAIAGEVENYFVGTKNRSGERQQELIRRYHNHLTSKIFQDIAKDIHSFTPNVIIPQVKVKYNGASNSDDTFEMTNSARNFCSTKIKASTPLLSTVQSCGDNPHIKNGTVEGASNRGLFSAVNSSEPPINFEDLSFDFIPCRIPKGAIDPDKLPTESSFSKVNDRFLKYCFQGK